MYMYYHMVLCKHALPSNCSEVMLNEPIILYYQFDGDCIAACTCIYMLRLDPASCKLATNITMVFVAVAGV